jgi:four helix bundle protein
VENRKLTSYLNSRIVEEEADETIYWLELLIESKIVEPSRVNLLLKETNEIIAMIVASIKTLRGR